MQTLPPAAPHRAPLPSQRPAVAGIDVLVRCHVARAEIVAAALRAVTDDRLPLAAIASDGAHAWRCRFRAAEPVTAAHLDALLTRLAQAGIPAVELRRRGPARRADVPAAV